VMTYAWTSIIATIERRYGINALAYRDSAVNDLSNVFVQRLRCLRGHKRSFNRISSILFCVSIKEDHSCFKGSLQQHFSLRLSCSVRRWFTLKATPTTMATMTTITTVITTVISKSNGFY